MHKLLADENGIRIDKYISEKLPSVSRSYAEKLISDGLVLCNGMAANKKYKIRCGDIIELTIPEAKTTLAMGEDIPLDIIYEDNELLVVNKPQGMVVHPAAGNYDGTLVNALINHCGDNLSAINGVIRPGIVHRIDKDTSGLLVVAKTDFAHKNLSQQIKDHKVTKIYHLIIHGNIKADSGTINAPIGRNPVSRKKMCVTSKNSREAITHYRVIERFGDYTYLECRLQTGRTHQIRVHINFMGSSIIGDKVYGVKKEKFKLKGQALHAKRLGFVHPKTGEYMEFESDLPEYFKRILKVLREGKNL